MLTGTLDDFTLADVLRLIAGARRSGALEVARDAGAGSLYFRDGAVSRAVARYDRRTEAGSPAGAAEDLAFDLMRWESGEFTWTPGAAAPSGPDAALDVDDLLRAVSKRLEELAEIQTLVPSEEAVLEMAAQPPEGAVQINITPAEWRVLVLVDGHRTVGEIAGAAHLDDLEAMKLLYGLAAAGLVAAAGAAPPKREVVPSGEVSDTTDMTAVSAVSDTPAGETHDLAVPAEEPPAPAQEPETPLPAAEAEEAPAPAQEPDPFLAGLALGPPAPVEALSRDVLDPPEVHEAPAVDRSTAARELAGLFDDVDPTQALGGMAMAVPPAPGGPGRIPRRVEDDDQVTRGLISRLIDGVKGL